MYSDIDNKFKVTFSSQGTPSHFSARYYLFLLHIQNFHILQCLLAMYSAVLVSVSEGFTNYSQAS